MFSFEISLHWYVIQIFLSSFEWFSNQFASWNLIQIIKPEKEKRKINQKKKRASGTSSGPRPETAHGPSRIPRPLSPPFLTDRPAQEADQHAQQPISIPAPFSFFAQTPIGGPHLQATSLTFFLFLLSFLAQSRAARDHRRRNWSGFPAPLTPRHSL